MLNSNSGTALKKIVCKYCGTEHACAGRMSNHERAKLAAVARAVKAEKRKQPQTTSTTTATGLWEAVAEVIEKSPWLKEPIK